MKKVGFLLPDFEEGGMPKVASNILTGLSNREFDKYLILLDRNSQLKYEHDAKVIFIIPRGKTKWQKIGVYIKRIFAIKKLKREQQFDTVISFGVAANIINIITKGREKTVCTEHALKSLENKTWGFLGTIYNFLMKRFYGKADQLVAISEVMKEDLQKNYAIHKPIDVIYNPHIVSHLTERSAELLDTEEQLLFSKGPNLVTVGRLTYAKGQWHLLRIMASLKQRFPDIQLFILGIGELEERLKKLAKQLQIDDNVHFLGFKSNPLKYIQHADIFVLSSLYEGLPNALIEALACRTPVISADCKSGPREILDGNKMIHKQISQFECCRYGILTPPFDGKMYFSEQPLTDAEKQMAWGIKRMLSDQELYLQYKERSLERAFDYDLSKILKEYEKII